MAAIAVIAADLEDGPRSSGRICATARCRIPRLEGEAFCYRHALQLRRQTRR